MSLKQCLWQPLGTTIPPPRMKNTNLSIVEHQQGLAARWTLAIDGLGLARAEVARQLDVSPQRLNGWLNGGHPAPVYYLAQFCRLHPIPLEWLVQGDERALSFGVAESLGLASRAKKSAD